MGANGDGLGGGEEFGEVEAGRSEELATGAQSSSDPSGPSAPRLASKTEGKGHVLRTSKIVG